MQVSTVLITQSPNGTFFYPDLRQYIPAYVQGTYLISDGLDYPREEVVFPLVVLHPRREVSHLTVVSIISKPHLGTNEENLLVVDNDATVVYHILMCDRPWDRMMMKDERNVVEEIHVHPNVTKNAHRIIARKNFRKDFPRVQDGVACDRKVDSRSANLQ